VLQQVVAVSGPRRAVEVLGVELVGVNAENGRKLLLTIVFVLLVLLLGRLFRRAAAAVLRGRRHARLAFWWRQGIAVAAGVVLLIGVTSIWFDDPVRLASALGLVTAGLAFALQKVVTALAGYLVILRGRTFNVGDRISMGGVRGDVMELGFLQRRYLMAAQDPVPRVYYRLTDNWLELALRFVVRDHGIREVKDAITRDVLRGLRDARIPVASTTIQLVGDPPLPSFRTGSPDGA
jgi:hypothetical protein